MNIKGIMASVLAVSIINVCGMTAVAATGATGGKGQAQPAWSTYVNGERFNRLVEGAASQEDLKLMRKNSEENEPRDTENKRWNMLENLLEAQVITKGEYDALKSAMETPSVRSEGLGAAKRSNPFARFVDEGIISEETSQNMMEYLIANRPAKRVRNAATLEEGTATKSEYNKNLEDLQGKAG